MNPFKHRVIEVEEIWATLFLIVLNLAMWAPYIYVLAYFIVPGIMDFLKPIE